MKTVSLELAKSLKEKGYPQDKGFFWARDGALQKEKDWFLTRIDGKGVTKADWVDYVASPTADEILEELPERIKGHKTIGMGKSMGEWLIGYQKIGNELQAIRFGDESIANAAAKLWFYLKENDLLGVK